jgi:exosortase A
LDKEMMMSRDDPQLPTQTATNLPAKERWRLALLIWAASLLVLGALFSQTLRSLAATWNGSATYNHCWLIVPIIGWLVWQRKTELAQLTPKPFWPGLVIALLAALVFLLGDAADANVVRQIGFVGILQASIFTIFGLQVARGLLFPLFYMIFLIPIGDEIVPLLQRITADFSVWMLHLVNIPVFRDGIFISIPTGNFEVAEACAGVRFLIATIALGTLYANIAFKSWQRRVLVVALFASIPVLANGIRAWGIIMIAHYSNNEYAVGADHIVYGWGFFFFITIILLLICRPFADRTLDDPAFRVDNVLQAHPVNAQPTLVGLVLAAGLVLASALASVGYGSYIDQRAPDYALSRLQAPEVAGWQKISPLGAPWQPLYQGADQTLLQTYENAQGARVVLYLAAYAKQREKAELIAFGNGTYGGESAWVWSRNLNPAVKIQGQATPAQAFRIQDEQGNARAVWQWYWVNGKIMASPARAKLEQTLAKLLGGPSLAATVVISAEEFGAEQQTLNTMQTFAGALGAPTAVVQTSISAASSR